MKPYSEEIKQAIIKRMIILGNTPILRLAEETVFQNAYNQLSSEEGIRILEIINSGFTSGPDCTGIS